MHINETCLVCVCLLGRRWKTVEHALNTVIHYALIHFQNEDGIERYVAPVRETRKWRKNKNVWDEFE